MTNDTRPRPVLRFLIIISSAEDQKKLEKKLDRIRIPIFCQLRAQGTASSETLDICGLSGSTRLMTVCLIGKKSVDAVFSELEKAMRMQKRGKGIAFTIPMTGIQSYMADALSACIQQRRKNEGDDGQMSEGSSYSMICVAVDQGYSDEAINAAAAAGALGGSILKGRRRGTEDVMNYLGLNVQDEQEFVIIVVPKDKKLCVMQAINEKCGIDSPAHGIIASVPVDETLGLV